MGGGGDGSAMGGGGGTLMGGWGRERNWGNRGSCRQGGGGRRVRRDLVCICEWRG